MPRPPVAASLLLALASACAGPGGARAGSAAGAELASIERALQTGDLGRARAELQLLRSRTGAPSPRVSDLEAALTHAEMAPFEPSFTALAAALEDGDLPLSRRIVERVLALRPRGSALERAQAFERVVAGRETMASLRFRIEVEPSDKPGAYDVALVVASALIEAVVVECPGGSLSFLAIGVEPSGIEQRSARSSATGALAHLEIEPGSEKRVPLGRFHLEVAGLIAARGRFELTVAPGLAERGGRLLPVGDLDVAPCEVVRLDPRLPGAPVEPSELESYVRRGAPSIAALLERAVRVDASRRGEAVARIAPLCAGLPDAELERLVPALRWLSSRRDLQGSEAWRRWLSTQSAQPSTSTPGGSAAQ